MANPSADYPTAVHTPIDVSEFTAAALGSTSPTHTELEGKQEQEIVAIQTKLGDGASAPGADEYLKGAADDKTPSIKLLCSLIFHSLPT